MPLLRPFRHPALAILIAAGAALIAGEGAVDPGWPMVNGPRGDWQPQRYGHTLVSDLNIARLVWVSEPLLGRVRIGRNPGRAAANGRVLMPGGCVSPIIGGGRIFITDYRPSGAARVAKQTEGLDAEVSAAFSVGADDVLVAIDLATGKTVWEAVEKDAGVNRWGGKRTEYGPSAAYHDGMVFSLGTTGMLYAYDAATGAKRWQTPMPGHAGMMAMREKAIAAGIQADGPMMHTSLVIADGVLVASDVKEAYSTSGLCGVDPKTGAVLWHAPASINVRGTPTLVRPEGRPLLLTYANKKMRCMDPRTGAVAWQVDGLGEMIGSLVASDRTVLVNVAVPTPTERKPAGRWGAYRLSATSAEPAWQLPKDPLFEWEWWLDAGGRRKIALRDGRVYITDLGGKGGFCSLIVQESDGAILWRSDQVEAPDRRAQMQHSVPLDGVPRLIEDRLLIAVDEAHGAAKVPIAYDHWRLVDGIPQLLSKNWEPEVEPATGYEVLLEPVYHDGFFYQRTLAGAIACYDLRRTAETVRLHEFALADGYRGLTQHPLPVRIYQAGDRVVPNASALPPDEVQAGISFGKDRRFARWERAKAGDVRIAGDAMNGVIAIDHGTGVWPVSLDATLRDGAWVGTWKRSVPGLAEPIINRGTVAGRGPATQQIIYTPWLAATPWTVRRDHPPGVATWALVVQGALPRTKDSLCDISLYLDVDGQRIVRAIATAFARTTAWHEVDASGVRVEGNRLSGKIEICFNPDRWVSMHPDGGSVGGTIELAVESRDGQLTGTHATTLGVPLAWTGEIGRSRITVVP